MSIFSATLGMSIIAALAGPLHSAITPAHVPMKRTKNGRK